MISTSTISSISAETRDDFPDTVSSTNLTAELLNVLVRNLCVNAAEGNGQVILGDEFTVTSTESSQSIFKSCSSTASLTQAHFDFSNDGPLVNHTDTIVARFSLDLEPLGVLTGTTD